MPCNQIAENANWEEGQSETFRAGVGAEETEGPWTPHVCMCMRKAAYRIAFEYLYLSMCLSTCAWIYLRVCVRVSLSLTFYISLSLSPSVCVCWVYLSKSKVLACKIYRVRCQAKTSFAAPLTFVFVTSFVSISQLSPKCAAHQSPFLSLSPLPPCISTPP